MRERRGGGVPAGCQSQQARDERGWGGRERVDNACV